MDRFFFKRIRANALLTAALPLLFAASAFAQDAGVSGIPPGPGNVNGLNGSVGDPSGIGNAAKATPLPSPTIKPATPVAAAPITSTRGVVRQDSTRALS